MTLTPYQVSTLRRAAKIMENLVKNGGSVLTSPERVREYLKYSIAAKEHECFTVIYLDSRHRVIAIDDSFFRGTVDHAAIYPREIIKEALRHNAAALIVAHNHPSLHSAEPSDTDIRLTRKLVDVLNLIDVRLVDHLIVAGPNFTSLAERGLM